MLEATNITKRYGDIVAVDDISLSVGDGELFSIVGPSGSGKSTLLRCIAGLETPQSGKIRLGSEDVTDEAAYERATSTVFQNLALFPHMTVKENIAYGMKRQKVDEKEREARINEYLELVDLPGYGDRKITQLSGGEQQRVALARSLSTQPELLLLDEPLASLDQQLRVQLQNELYELQRTLDQTAIYVTHDQNVALSISDRVAVMNEGEIEQVGTPRELYDQPQTEFVASFIGDSTRFRGTATAVQNGTVTIGLENSEKTIDGDRIDDIEAGDSVVGIVKIEEFDVNSPEKYENRMEGIIDRISYQGQQTKLLLEAENGGLFEVLASESNEYDTGEKVSVGWSREDCSAYGGGE